MDNSIQKLVKFHTSWAGQVFENETWIEKVNRKNNIENTYVLVKIDDKL